MLPVYWVPYISFRGPVKYDCGPRVLGSEARGQGRFVPGRFVAGVGSGPNERARRGATLRAAAILFGFDGRQVCQSVVCSAW